MRSVRLLAAAAATVAVAAGSLAGGPATASPEDGEGCAGLPSVPAAYVCLVSANPENAKPTITTKTVTVTVPEVCYVAGCTGPTPVNVPVPGAQANEGDIAVLYYNGAYYPIGIGAAGGVVPLVNDTVTLAVDTVNGVVDGLPTTAEIVDAVRDAIAPYQQALQDLVDGLPTPQEVVDIIERSPLYQRVKAIVDDLCLNCIT